MALGACSNASDPEPSPAASPSVEPSLENAIWEGTWDFNYTLIRLVGATPEETDFEPGNQIQRIWAITPGCPDRPCASEVSATNPAEPEAGAAVSVVTYENGVYRIEQNFPPEITNACRGADGTVIDSAFVATNTVEVTPTDFEVQDGRTVVTRMTAIKRTTFAPTAEAAAAGGTCEQKYAEWEATVTPAAS